MKPYMLLEDDLIPHEDLKLLEKISTSLKSLKSADFEFFKKINHSEPVILSCHILARSVANVFKLEFRDGAFYPNFNHSWVVTPNGNIIDIYPIGIITVNQIIEPLFIHSYVAKRLYIENQPGNHQFDEDTGRLIWGQDEYTEQTGFNDQWFSEAVEHTIKVIPAKAPS
jgi:hypothetical protein